MARETTINTNPLFLTGSEHVLCDLLSPLLPYFYGRQLYLRSGFLFYATILVRTTSSTPRPRAFFALAPLNIYSDALYNYNKGVVIS
jgi:hypothetical protein